MIEWAVLFVSVALIAFTVFCFLRLFVAQVRLISEMIDPAYRSAHSENAGRPTNFFYRTDPKALEVRSKWSQSCGYLVLAAVVMFLWFGVMYGLLEINDATSGKKFVVNGRLQ